MTVQILHHPEDDTLHLKQADNHLKEEQLLQAVRCLRRVKDTRRLTEAHHRALQTAPLIEAVVHDLLEEPRGHWNKQGESHSGKYDTVIYYKTSGSAQLTCRMESPVPFSMLVPLLSVLNESSLYQTWIPSWKKPIQLGVRQSKQILHDTRGHQIIQVQCDIPWPMTPREVLMDVTAVDDIESSGWIVAKMHALTEESTTPPGFVIPPLESQMARADFDGAVLFRACPLDYPNYKRAKQRFPNEPLVLLQFSMFFDAHMRLVPQSMINFVTRTVIGHVWNRLLSVAEQVPEGTRTEHGAAIQEKAEFYQWVEDRCQVMLRNMQQDNETANHLDASACVPAAVVVTKALEPQSTSPSSDEDDHEESTPPWTMQEVLKISI